VSFNHEPNPPTGVSPAQALSRPRLLQGQVVLSPADYAHARATINQLALAWPSTARGKLQLILDIREAMAANEQTKDDMPELPSDHQPLRRPYRRLLLYGPWALAFLAALVAFGLLVDRAGEVVVAAIGFGSAMFIAVVLLPRMRGPGELGPDGVKGAIEGLSEAMRLVTVTAKEAAEQAIPAQEPDKERRVNEIVGHTAVWYVKDTLAQEFERQAEWRDRKAKEYPDEARIARAAAGLRGLADYVRRLPDDDPRLRRLAEVWSSPTPYDGAAELLLNKYGFGPGSHLGPPDHDFFLTSYADEWSMVREK
jgi:hypothetical protein